MDFNIWRKIRSLAGTPNRTPEQERRFRKLNEEYSSGKVHYTAPLTYPTKSQTFSNPSMDAYPVQIRRDRLAEYHSLLPQEPFESDESYYHRLRDAFAVRKLITPKPVFNPNPSQGFFGTAKQRRTARSYTALDIETDDYGHPIAITAIKFQKSRKGEFKVVDTYQRYYKAHSWNLKASQAVHGLTSRSLRSLRTQQKATYHASYDESEMTDLWNFLGSSTLVGHNILQFDLPRLFPGLDVRNPTMDTLMAARSAWKGKKNDLDSVFQRIFGMTMEEAGLNHHDAGADVLASMMILDAMSKDEGLVGKSIQYIMKHAGHLHLAEWDDYVNSMVTRGRYYEQFGKGKHDIGATYMTAQELGIGEFDKEEGKMKYVGGMHEVDQGDINPDNQTDEELINSAVKETTKNLGKGIMLGSGELLEAFNEFNTNKRASLIKQLAAASSDEEATALLRIHGYGAEGPVSKSMTAAARYLKGVREQDEIKKLTEQVELGNWRLEARELTSRPEEFDRNQALRKMSYLDRMERKGLITEKQRATLDLVDSYDDLVNATEDAIDANERLLKVYEAMGKIKPYDINQYISSAKQQWSGTMGAARGVVPNFVRNPISRLGDAAFNAIDRSVSPWNAFNRTWNSGIGATLTAAGGIVGGVPGMMVGSAISGGVSALSQVVGNTAQAKMEMRMLGIQNNLNTLGAMISWISTPFQMLHKAIKLVTGAFGGLSLKLNNIMGGGINMMSQMGNPLEELTGVNYLNYQQAGLVDMASLLKGGSTNAAIEKLAMIQRDLYRYGKVDTDKMIAANMLGVFAEAFSPTTDAAGAYYSMANKILNNLRAVEPGSDAERNIMYYANKFDPTLAQTLRSANLLGVTDIRQMTSPDLTGNYMYWRPITEGRNGEEGRFRRTQYEYGVATQQFGYTKMRFADKLWNVVGRDIYNGMNRVIDALADGDWKTALSSAEDTWEALKKTWSGVWAEMNKDNKLGNKLSEGLNNGLKLIKEWGWKAAVGIIDIWNQIFGKILEKSQGLIAYLSTVQVKLTGNAITGWGLDISTINSTSKLDPYAPIYDSTGRTYQGMEDIDALAKKYIPYYEENKLYKRMTPMDVAQGLFSATVGNGEGISFDKYHLENYPIRHRQDALDVLEMLWKGGSKGPGYRVQASASMAPENVRSHMNVQELYNETMGIMPMYEKMTDALMNDIIPSIGKQVTSKNNEINIDIVNKEGRTSVDVNGRPIIDTSGNPILSQMVLEGTRISATKRN